MIFSMRAKLELAAGVLFVASAGVGFASWLGQHDARLKAESDAAAKQAAFDRAGEQMKAEKAADLERDRQAAASMAQIVAAAAAQKTPSQIASWIPQQLPTPQPITITVPPPTHDNPTPNAIASIPQADLPALRDTIANCQSLAVALPACKQDLAGRDREAALAGKQIEALKGEVQDWKRAAGKTFWTRVWHYTEIGGAAAIGVLAGRASKK